MTSSFVTYDTPQPISFHHSTTFESRLQVLELSRKILDASKGADAGQRHILLEYFPELEDFSEFLSRWAINRTVKKGNVLKIEP
jgi:hypothetical protein